MQRPLGRDSCSTSPLASMGTRTECVTGQLSPRGSPKTNFSLMMNSWRGSPELEITDWSPGVVSLNATDYPRASCFCAETLGLLNALCQAAVLVECKWGLTSDTMDGH